MGKPPFGGFPYCFKTTNTCEHLKRPLIKLLVHNDHLLNLKFAL